MKIWNRTEYDNGQVGLVITATVEELKDIWLDGDPYDVVSKEDAGNGRLLVVVKERDLRQAIPVLDHGLVRLVDSMGSDLAIVRSARVSFDADWRAGDDDSGDAKLIRYLEKNRHTTPFESVELQFEIQIPMFLARQWHRHRTQSYNEVSARYTEIDMGYYLPEPLRIGVQSKSNKQVRDFPDMISDNELKINKVHIKKMQSIMDASWRHYQDLVAEGVPTELARIVLPLASYTRFFAKMNLHNLFHFLELRLHSHAQWEIREYAEAMLELTEPVAPIAVAAFKERIGYDG